MKKANQTAKKNTFYLIHGEDEFLVAEKARQLIRQYVPTPEQSLALEIIDARAGNTDEAVTALRQCLESLRTLGLFSREKIIWLRDASFLDAGKLGKIKIVKEFVEELTALINAPLSHVLIITSSNVDERTAFYKTCKVRGKIFQYKLLKVWNRDKAACQNAVAAFREHGLEAAHDVLTTFVTMVGTDTRHIHQETDKLAMYLHPEKKVTLDALQEILSSTRQLFTWDLEDAICDGDSHLAMANLRKLLFQKESHIRLIIGLESRFRNLLVMKEALVNRWLAVDPHASEWTGPRKGKMPAETERLLDQALSVIRPVAQARLLKQAQWFSHGNLLKCLQLTFEAHRKFVSKDTPPALLFEMLIIRLCMLRQSTLKACS